jgi:membrane fusion protein, copper/silver efflux system
MFTRRTLTISILLALMLGASLAAGVTAALIGTATNPPAAHDHDHAAEQAATQYTCPMHPTVVSDRPGVCPICHMDLVPKKSGAGGALDSQTLAAAGRVSLSSAQRVLANVQTVEARPGQLKRELRAVGIAAYDETGLSSVPSWVAGRIDRLWIKETGKKVVRGQRLMTLYSPTLLTAQEELIALTRDPQPQFAPIIAPARRRLELLGMSAAQIDAAIKRGKASAEVTIYSPGAGTITEIMARQGQYVEVGTPLLQLADLKDVWIEAQVYEHQRAQIREGMSARVTTTAYPGESFAGRVTLILPSVNAAARTTPVRIELDEDAARRFKPGMYTTVFFDQSAPEADGVIIPLDAIIRTGRHSYVYVEIEPDLFERREVVVLAADDGQAQLISGVAAGEHVAATGGFLIDSELQLRAPVAVDPHAGHDMGAATAAATATKNFVELPPEGKKFAPPIALDQVPPGAWYCDMGTVEYARPDQGDGRCAVCGMTLKQKPEVAP